MPQKPNPDKSVGDCCLRYQLVGLVTNASHHHFEQILVRYQLLGQTDQSVCSTFVTNLQRLMTAHIKDQRGLIVNEPE